jgi:2-oxo-4-hydroxy-4-carboxy-5-ureidoimidazoline decarboxylase
LTTTVKDLDAMKPDQARGLLAECCGSSKWVNEMTARRPFRTRENVFKAADEVADTMGASDWLEAFSHHPRIGEKPEMKSGISAGVEWATMEQAGMEAAGNYAKIALMRANQEYERRFGYIYIVCATGKSADEMIGILHERLGNDPDKELRVAADEQRKITRLRLEKLLDEEKKKAIGAKQ